MAGIYLHIPFCRRACNYCDFHFSTNLTRTVDLPAALLKEMMLRSGYLDGEVVETIYFGGGTPSLMEMDGLDKVMDGMRKQFTITADAEITLEANPDDIDDGRLLGWKRAGINRLSIGLQSFFDDDLLWMNRAHDARQSRDAVALAQAAGFQNINIDLIYGLPGAPDARWLENMSKAFDLGVPHLSCYALTVEPRTALAHQIAAHRSAGTDPDQQARQFGLLMDAAAAAGYEHYEISNFSKPGFRSRHNTAYWLRKKYLGLGPSAHSFDGHSRQWNVASNNRYLDALEKNERLFEREDLSETEKLNEFIMVSLRMSEGLDLSAIERLFGPGHAQAVQERAKRFGQLGHLQETNDHLILTGEGKYFADGIAAGLFA